MSLQEKPNEKPNEKMYKTIFDKCLFLMWLYSMRLSFYSIFHSKLFWPI